MAIKLIEGYGDLEVKRSEYVLIGKKRYLKKDYKRVALVRSVETGKSKYYLITSPLIRACSGSYHLDSECVFVECSQRYVNKFQNAITRLDGKNYLSYNVVPVNGKNYFIRDERIAKDIINRNMYILKTDSVEIHPNIYGKNANGSLKRTLKPELNGRPLVVVHDSKYYARESDTTRLINSEGVVEFHDRGSIKHNVSSAFVGFINPETRSFDDNLKQGVCYSKDTEKYFHYHEKTSKYVHLNQLDYYNEIYDEWFDLKHKPSIDKAIKKANLAFSDVDEDENKPSFMRFERSLKPRHGAEMGYDGRMPFMLSKTASSLGGMQYTFGVEIETSNGFLSMDEMKKVQLCAMGDNSILGNEYITQALHGDLGVELIKAQMNMIQSRCVVDDTCSIHVHIGGWNNPKVWTPNFNIAFAVNAVKLGCKIEEDLFKTQPKSRHPFKKHCHCITSDSGDYSGDFRHISMENYKALLGRYVFGRTIDRDINQMMTPPRWNSERYKWLNLINALSMTKIDTIEFRIFAPTTTFWKVLQAIRISLAFVWFVENRQREINEKTDISLVHVLTEAYKSHKSVLEDVLYYVESRTKKFNRENVYKF